MRVLRTLAALVLFATASLSFAAVSSSQATGAHQLIQGSGSSWAALAVQQWISDVSKSGLQVVFSPTGSAQGRIDFANATSDFAISDIGFLGKDPVTGANDTSNGRQYAYLPIVAGGTSLPYHIVKDGQLVRNLRLSGQTIAKIFTRKITNWDDPEITSDNNGNAMPNLPIIPVQHSEGSGSSYQFTAYMHTEFPSIWTQVADEYFPQASGNAVAENGSDQVMNFLTSSAADGAIAYDEYAYALAKNYPVAKVLNSGGYYTLPTQYNVAVGLTQAQINNDPTSANYLLQTLTNVYTYNDARTYPMSSYSYAIIPTGANDPTMNTAKRQTLADYLQYSICAGQAEMGQVGYSPLPLNLVESSFSQIKKLNAADPNVDISNQNPQSCSNPTFVAGNPNANYLAQVAPQPPACDKQGAGPCAGAGSTGQANPVNGKVSQTGAGNAGGTSGSGSGSGTGAANAGPAGGGALATTGANASATTIDPNTGQAVSTGGAGSGAAGVLAANTLLPAAQSSATDLTLGIIAGALLLGVLVAPTVIATRAAGAKRPVDGDTP